jgi:putative endopeptidase
VLRDYLRFHLVSAYAEYLGPDIDAEHFAFHYRVLQGQKEQKPRWKRVLDTENDFGSVAHPIGMMVGRRFVAEHFPEQAKKRYVDMVQAVIEAFRERIGKLDWMTDATKPRALEKLDALYAKVGYPDNWPDYSDLVIGRSSYCENVMNIERWRFRQMLARFGKPVDRAAWRMTPQTYNAYYSRSNNEIVLPAAIFMVPGIGDAQIDDAVAYGYAGASTIGHEITHGFDDAGRKFDARGNLADWWTADDAAEFQKRAWVLVRQFDAYEPLPGFHINGSASAGENIADFGGIVIALDAFKKTDAYKSGAKVGGLTPLQRFFLGYAYSWMTQVREEQLRRRLLSDVHAPPKWRVLGPLSNLPDFYEAFDVTENQAMWRAVEDRADVW